MALARLAKEQGRFHGDIDAVQSSLVQWMMTADAEAERELEDARMRYTILAGNIPLYQQLYKEQNPDADEWITPTSAAELDELMSLVEGTGSEREIEETS